MKTQHTPGPWHWWDRKDGRPKKYDLAKLYGEHGRQILSMYGGEGGNALGTTKEAIANAALIASAPALYEALEKVETIIKGLHTVACNQPATEATMRHIENRTMDALKLFAAAALASATPQGN